MVKCYRVQIKDGNKTVRKHVVADDVMQVGEAFKGKDVLNVQSLCDVDVIVSVPTKKK